MADYIITNITFSTRQEVSASVASVGSAGVPAADFTNTFPPTEGIYVTGNRIRTTYLDAHVEFIDILSDSAGVCVVELQKVCEVEFDDNGKITSYTPTALKYKSYDEVKNCKDVTDAVEAEILSMDYNLAEKTYTKDILSQYKLYSPVTQ